MKRYLIILVFSLSTLISWGQYQTSNLDFLFNGSIAVNGSDTLLVDSITGTFDTGYILTFVDFDITLDYLPGKTAAKLNDQPICTYFQNGNYADTAFTQWLDQELNADLTENKPFRMQRIAHYSTPTTDVNDFFETPPIATVDFTEVGVGKTHSTISAAIAASSVGDTIYVYDGDYDETNYTYWRYQDIIAVGDCYLTSTGATYVILTSTEYNVTMSGFEIDAENAKANCISGSSVFNGKHLTNCYLKNANSRVIQYTTTSSQTITNKISKCVAIDEPEILSNAYCNFSECYFKNIVIRSSVAIDSLRVEYSRYKFTNPAGFALNFNANIANVYVNYNSWEDIIANTIVDARQSVLKGNFYFVGNTVTTDSIIVAGVRPDLYTNVYFNNNTFINNSFTQVPNLLIGNFRNAYVRDNYFTTETGDIYAIDISSTTMATELYVERNIDSSYADNGYFLRIGSETTTASDNNISKIVVRYNEGFGLKYFQPGSIPSTHGLLIGFESNDQTIAYNNFNGYGLNYVFKGSSSTYSDEVKIWSNLSQNAYLYGFYSKGIDSVKYYNNTSYNDNIAYYFTENTGSDPAIHNEVINSIIETSTGGYAYQFDVNSSSNFTSSNNVILSDNIALYNGTGYTWSTWQGLGQDVNSFNTDPLLDINLCPASNSDAVFNGLNLGSPYNIGLVCGTSFPNPTTRSQTFPSYTIGAIVIDKQINSVVRVVGGSLWGFGTGVVGY